MTPEEAVEAWWSALNADQRKAVGLNIMRAGGRKFSADGWSVDWDDLLPVGQKRRVHEVYDGMSFLDDATPLKLLSPPQR
jgi:hypothetical protein